jgi:hypothetical protein
MRPSVMQHQYAISSEPHGSAVLSTKGILICTGWYGWDPTSGIGFLCHFDRPGSASSVPEIIRELRQVAPENHRFRSVLVGGKEWFWSMGNMGGIWGGGNMGTGNMGGNMGTDHVFRRTRSEQASSGDSKLRGQFT